MRSTTVISGNANAGPPAPTFGCWRQDANAQLALELVSHSRVELIVALVVRRRTWSPADAGVGCGSNSQARCRIGWRRLSRMSFSNSVRSLMRKYQSTNWGRTGTARPGRRR